MRDQLRHRGPDDEGLWQSSDGRIGLGHTRLSIIDLSQNGHQPMQLPGASHVIVFNGEIYNFQKIRSDLVRMGHAFRSNSDTEVILHSYQQWGTDCVQHLDGMFAFAIYDQRTQSIFLARDRVGEKPLYYVERSGMLVWASEAKALLEWPDFRARLDPRALREYLTYGFVGGEACIYQGMRKLLPAHCAVFELSQARFRTWRYWTIPSQAAAVPSSASNNAIDELQALLDESVTSRSVADVPTGILLSSGIDSALIAAIASRRGGSSVKTFTVAQPDAPEIDEGPGARAIANLIGSTHTELEVESPGIPLLEILARQFDEPLADQSIIPTHLICKALKDEVKVVMTGDGGDELFGGYPHYRLMAKQARARQLLPASVRSAASWAARNLLPIGFRGRNHLNGLSGEMSHAIANINVYFDAHSQERLLVDRRLDGGELQLVRGGRILECSYANAELQAMCTDLLTVLPDNYLVKTDRASMLASVELRAPFLNPTLIDFAFNRVPQSMRILGSEQKVLPRRLLARLLPQWSPSRRKQGFVVPMREWLAGDVGVRFREILLDSGQTLFDKAYIERLFSLNRMGMHNAHRIFCLVMFELWRRHYQPALP